MDRSLIVVIAVFVGGFTLAGCEANHYEVELTPQDGSMKRDLTAWREGGGKAETDEATPFPEDELEKIAAAYDAEVPEKRGKKHQFSKPFDGEMPDDVGGAGRFLHWETSLGSASVYVERFRGDGDLLAEVQRRLDVSDRLADLLIGWLATEMQDQPGFADLRSFLNEDMRRDLKNLTLSAWRYGLEFNYDDSTQWDFLIRSGQYLAERGYFSPGDLPQLTRAAREAEEGHPEKLLAIIRRFAATKMGVASDEPIPDSLDFLNGKERISASVNTYLRQTEEFQSLMKEWQRKKADDPKAEPPEPGEVIGGLLRRAFAFTIAAPDRLAVKLNLPAAPAITNGDWNPNKGHVKWSKILRSAGSEFSEYPTVLHAVWSQPDEKTQTRHFGRVLLKGKSLCQYCLWHQGLSESEAKEWDKFLSSLKPDQDLDRRLRDFHFTGDKDPNPAKLPRQLLLDAFNEKTQ